MRSLQGQHQQARGKQTSHPKVGDVVIIRDSSKNRNHWKLTVVTDLIKEIDGIMRAASLKSNKETFECAIQHLHPLELACVKEP